MWQFQTEFVRVSAPRLDEFQFGVGKREKRLHLEGALKSFKLPNAQKRAATLA